MLVENLTTCEAVRKRLLMEWGLSCEVLLQMPKGVPVATVAIGNAANAGLLALRILAASDAALQQQMLDYQVCIVLHVQLGATDTLVFKFNQFLRIQPICFTAPEAITAPEAKTSNTDETTRCTCFQLLGRT